MISDGSVIAVADGQCMIIVEQGQVVDICAEPGEFTYDMSTEPSVFTGDLSETVPAVLKNIGKRFTFGGEAPKDQRVYYFNTKELVGNKYGTPSPIPFRVVDANVGLDVDISIRCFGEYSYRISNPVLFYSNVCGNVEQSYDRSEIDSQLKSELMTGASAWRLPRSARWESGTPPCPVIRWSWQTPSTRCCPRSGASCGALKLSPLACPVSRPLRKMNR